MTLDSAEGSPGEWVLLSYRMPREPSTPRIAVWRKLKRLGVAQLADGVVGLPADARTREHLEWLADEVIDAGGTAGIWTARPATAAQERELAGSMAAARSEEYRAIIAEAGEAAGLDEGGRTSAARRLRAELRRVTRRDYFPPDERDHARQAVDALVRPVAEVDQEAR
ncbi:Chromate resistance protein ChrB [Saccharopolyspora sp. NPDC049426]|uniref:Chromate resistance protein ChrB n=1 Tax=Saccharopolyspora sp. NPDC049426 TaxID=3155652 RepID=UPI003420BCB5